MHDRFMIIRIRDNNVKKMTKKKQSLSRFHFLIFPIQNVIGSIIVENRNKNEINRSMKTGVDRNIKRKLII